MLQNEYDKTTVR